MGVSYTFSRHIKLQFGLKTTIDEKRWHLKMEMQMYSYDCNLMNVKHSRKLHIHVSLGTVDSGGHVCWDLTNVR